MIGKMKKIVVAPHNPGKLKEIKEILKNYELLSLKDINCEIEVEENQETFEGNSKKKAKEISEATNMPCIADDSGLCIEAFKGWPGVHTARFLGENATPSQRNEAILEKMRDLKREERKAKNSQNKNEEEKTGEKPNRKKASKKKDEVTSEISSSDKPNTVVGDQEKSNIEKVEENKKDVVKTTEGVGESESTAKQVIRKMRGEKVDKPDAKKDNK